MILGLPIAGAIIVYIIISFMAYLLLGLAMLAIWEEFPGIVKDYRDWKKARAKREANDPRRDFEYHKRLAREEVEKANYFIHSFYHAIAVVIWPVSIPLVTLGFILYGIYKLAQGLYAFATNVRKIYESASGI